MHARALHATKDPALDKYEIEYTRKERRGALWNSMVGAIAVLFALINIEWLSGICYLAIPVVDSERKIIPLEYQENESVISCMHVLDQTRTSRQPSYYGSPSER
jgi:hypothetical protein